MPAMPSQLMISVALPALLSAVLTAVFLATLKRGRWLALPIALLPLCAVYLLNPDIRVYSIHGMYHTGIVYGVAGNGAPPENPFFAGEPLQYPWVYHALVARIAQLGDLPPSWVFAAISILSIAVTCVLVARLSVHCNGKDALPSLAVFLALFAALFSAVAHYLRGLDIGGYWYALGMPMAGKALNVNAMPFGVVFFTIAVISLLRVLGSRSVSAGWLMGLALGLLGSGYFYPLVWIGLVAGCGAGVGYTLLFERQHARGAWLAGLVVAGATAVLWPFFDSLAGARSQEASLKITRSPRFVLEHVAHLFVLLLPFWLLLAACPRALLKRLRERHAARLLALFGLALMGTFVLLDVNGAEYKLRTLAVLCLGVLAAPALTRLWGSRKLLCGGVVAVLLFPLAREVCLKATMSAPVPDPYTEAGFVLRHADLDQDEMYRWIAEETSTDSIFVDPKATIPVFGRRAMFVAGEIEPGMNGWRRTPEHFLQLVNGHPAERIAERYAIVKAIYGEDGGLSPDEIRLALGRVEGDRPVFVVARDAATGATLGGRSYLRRVAAGDGWSIFEVI